MITKIKQLKLFLFLSILVVTVIGNLNFTSLTHASGAAADADNDSGGGEQTACTDEQYNSKGKCMAKADCVVSFMTEEGTGYDNEDMYGLLVTTDDGTMCIKATDCGIGEYAGYEKKITADDDTATIDSWDDVKTQYGMSSKCEKTLDDSGSDTKYSVEEAAEELLEAVKDEDIALTVSGTTESASKDVLTWKVTFGDEFGTKLGDVTGADSMINGKAKPENLDMNMVHKRFIAMLLEMAHDDTGSGDIVARAKTNILGTFMYTDTMYDASKATDLLHKFVWANSNPNDSNIDSDAKAKTWLKDKSGMYDADKYTADVDDADSNMVTYTYTVGATTNSVTGGGGGGASANWEMEYMSMTDLKDDETALGNADTWDKLKVLDMFADSYEETNAKNAKLKLTVTRDTAKDTEGLKWGIVSLTFKVETLMPGAGALGDKYKNGTTGQKLEYEKALVARETAYLEKIRDLLFDASMAINNPGSSATDGTVEKALHGGLNGADAMVATGAAKMYEDVSGTTSNDVTPMVAHYVVLSKELMDDTAEQGTRETARGVKGNDFDGLEPKMLKVMVVDNRSILWKYKDALKLKTSTDAALTGTPITAGEGEYIFLATAGSTGGYHVLDANKDNITVANLANTTSPVVQLMKGDAASFTVELNTLATSGKVAYRGVLISEANTGNFAGLGVSSAKLGEMLKAGVDFEDSFPDIKKLVDVLAYMMVGFKASTPAAPIIDTVLSIKDLATTGDSKLGYLLQVKYTKP